MADQKGFEPLNWFLNQLQAFQACDFSHSSTDPLDYQYYKQKFAFN